MQKLIKIATVGPVLLALLLAGCSLDTPGDPTGSVNAPGLEDAGARYVAIGNSLTAGFMDGGLMQAGQINSYPRLIANQLGLSNTEFTQPWIAAPGIGSSTPSDPSLIAGVLHFDGLTIGVLGETPAADVQASLLLAVSQPTPYHNLGVPGALLTDGRHAYDALSSVGQIPFFEFINRASFFGNEEVALAAGPPPITTQSASMHYKAIAKGGALTTVWLGNNDVLGAATSGNPGVDVPLTDVTAFTMEYTAMLQTLAGGLMARNGFPATIVTANIPSVTSTPFFVPESIFDNAVQAQIGVSWPGGYTDTNVQFVLFPALGWIATATPTDPIPSNLTLSQAEFDAVNAATIAFNTVIASVTAGVNAAGIAKCAMFDANATLSGLPAAQKTHFSFLLASGMTIADAAATTYFSLDGVHPNNQGYGFVANAFIDEINALDGTSIPHVDLGTLSWDPTYGQMAPTSLAAGDRPAIGLTPRAATGMSAIFHP